MVKVQCLKCGNVQDTYAKWFFSCNKCGEKQTIENSVFNNQTSLQNGALSNPSDQQSRTETIETQIEISNQKPLESEILEIEEQPVIVEKTPVNVQKESFKCPKCGFDVEEYQDCTNPQCLAEIIWSEEQ